MAVSPDFDSESDTNTDVNDEIIDTMMYKEHVKVNAESKIRLVDGSPVHLKHQTLHTTFIGVRHHESTAGAAVDQFRGIKYAYVPLRFRRSVLFDAYTNTFDATKYGPICPQIRNIWLETRLYGLPSEIIPKQAHVPSENEFECCNLTVTTPASAHMPAQELLPVMVYVHSGGNVTGSGNEWIWDAGALVRRSIQIGKPVVFVALNFRLGLFGFGASELLREDNAAAGEEGVGNYGLHDQRTALLWIRKYISGFGGDPYNITFFGSSWGAADVHAHLLSSANQADVTTITNNEGPLFHRAILQSGALVPSSSVVQDVASAGRHLGRIMSALHIHEIDQLRAIPAAKLVALTGERVRPVDDGFFLRKDWRTLALPYSATEKARWRQDVIIGDVACESVLWATPARLWGADAVSRRARAIVQSVRRADALMRAYDIVDAEKGNSGANTPLREVPPSVHDSAVTDDDEETGSSGSGSDDAESELAERVMELMNDVAFAWPVDVSARCAADSAFVFEDRQATTENGYLSSGSFGSGSESDRSPFSPSPSTSEITITAPGRSRPLNAPYVYRYVFDQGSPYTQTPHHGIDLLYLFGNIPFPTDPDLTPEENDEVNWDRVKVRDEIQGRWLAFAHNEEPWDALTPQPPAGVANMSDKGIFATPMLSPMSSLSLAGAAVGASPVSSRSSSFSHTGSIFSDVSAASRSTSFSQHVNSPFFHSHHSHHHHQHHHGWHHNNGHANGQLYGPSHPPPISISESDKVFVFGPEGETGTRSAKIFAGRRRVHAWREALAPLGLATAQKVGLELGNGPPVSGVSRF